MYGQNIIVAAALAGVAAAHYPQVTQPPHVHNITNIGVGVDVVVTTKVVNEYVTYCPRPTVFVFNHKKYTVTKATTLTIKDCPCTIVEPCHTCGVVAPTPVIPGGGGVVYPGPPLLPGADVPLAPGAGAPAAPGAGAPAAPGAGAPAAPAGGAGGAEAQPPVPAVEVGSAGVREIAYSFAMAAAGLVGYLAL
ncbi:hypothetical protein HIM_02589 [Hirsutella minnesotensis 3608]|nr:hypothetical protein HIM_02589 [Hirsutella minnesotensis 3608]